jgi:thioesterase domain-containing protein
MESLEQMYKIDTPSSEQDFADYFSFRWKMLREPWKYPEGSEKDEYEQVSQHRMIRNPDGDVIAVGRVHMNSAEEAQVRHVAVEKDYQGKGLAKMLVASLEAVARTEGAVRIVTNSTQASVALFTSLGFKAQSGAPKELGEQQRQQMVKKLTDPSSILLHPKWCKLLQSTWHDTIPISKQMGIKIHQYTGRTLETRASLNKNINLHGTMFAGSIFSLATLTGWGMIFLQLKEKGLDGDIVLGDGNIHYHKPITMQPRALCNIESLSGKLEPLSKNKKCQIKLNVAILDGDHAVAEFSGVFWVLPNSETED